MPPHVCTILVAWRCRDRAPLVLAANRDELRSRPSAPPAVLDGGPPVVVGGRDLAAGGTWLAIAADGRVAAVTNRRTEVVDPRRRSRGELPLALLRVPEDQVEGTLAAIPAGTYNPCNVLFASRSRALVAEAPDGGAMRTKPLAPGPHVVTVADLDDPSFPKARRLLDALTTAAAAHTSVVDLLRAMEGLLRDHGESEDPLAAPCVHADGYGTVSSSSVVLWADGRVTFRHAPGPPCRVPYEDHSALLG